MVRPLNCIVAVSQNMGIGKNGDLPWPPLREPPQGAHFLAQSLIDALKLIEEPELANKVDMVWIVGGSSVYKEAMNQPGHLKLFVTRIMQEFESDTFFPEIDLEKYKLLPELLILTLREYRSQLLFLISLCAPNNKNRLLCGSASFKYVAKPHCSQLQLFPKL
ncbi:dihydrofolate reductase isoform X3 [Castor canadensis]|uniref:Dihydrofolate reductase isoform X3 n=1 Tax=Castor canadensis TaxID=51338 RepID=A0AC58MV66_CASCN